MSVAGGLLHDLAELLDAMEVATLEDLEEVIDGELDYDCHLIRHPEGVEVRIHVTGILVAYPFMLTELWATAHELEEEAEADFAAEYAGEGLE